MEKIRAGVIIKEIRMLQSEYPEAIYQNDCGGGCSYSKGSVAGGSRKKGCLIGQALRNTYPDVYKAVKKLNDYVTIASLISELGIVCTENQKNWLINVQTNQDASKPWGICHK